MKIIDYKIKPVKKLRKKARKERKKKLLSTIESAKSQIEWEFGYLGFYKNIFVIKFSELHIALRWICYKNKKLEIIEAEEPWNEKNEVTIEIREREWKQR